MSEIERFTDDLLAGRRPRRFAASESDAELMRVAIELNASRLGTGVPREKFVGALHDRLAAELGKPRKPVSAARRRVVWAGGIAAASATLGALADRLFRATPREEFATGSTLDSAANTWQAVAPSSSLAEGSALAFDLGVVTGFVARTDGRLHAVSGVCPHLGCRLTLDGPARQLACPCHPATFSLTGDVVRYDLPVELPPLPRIEVREADGTVQVFVPPRRV